MVELTGRGFVIENEWFWRITENGQTLDVAAALRDFLTPLAHHAKAVLAISELAAGPNCVSFRLAGQPVTVGVMTSAHDRVALNHFVVDLNRVLASLHLSFALVAPRRYELRGVLLTDDESASLAGNPVVLVPSGRPSSRSISTPTTV